MKLDRDRLWNTLSEYEDRTKTDIVDALLTDIEAQGFVIVPREATDKMIARADGLDWDCIVQSVLPDKPVLRPGFGDMVWFCMVDQFLYPGPYSEEPVE